MHPDRLLAARVLREEALREGFTRCGVAAAEGPPPRFERFERWIDAGRHAGMRYLARTREVRRRPEALLPGARSIVCLAAPHSAQQWVASDGARFARYARGADYHGTLRQRALRVAASARERLDFDFAYRVCVDSTPLSERALAAAAGLGWIGKNGCLIDPDYGSYLLLAEIVTDLDLPLDAPAAERCGSCVRCLEACPTGAFTEPGVLDAGRCLAYWTIEHRGPIPDPWKQALGDRVFGCDACQEACPWNAPLPVGASNPAPAPTRVEILAMGKGAWRRRFGKT
ncbi:MAG: tRNA epoxyqueuosine(34) reductase QueG, partial [Thermoanaerobaculia bacterium]